ncbi:carbohydrate ABC transporter permease [Candidatus Leptofilum sp.]|uniref:carbohydrate ABC transporter permease n=1 Tax=Candidatus Leptofilum sp. TaxID=3241576 RepID=UPI003B5B59BE
MSTTTTTPVAQPTVSSKKVREAMWTNVSMGARYVILTAVALLVFMPFILAFLGTFKTNLEIIAFPPTFLPETWLWENWPTLFRTDLGGQVQVLGTTSIGLTVGAFAFFATFLVTGLSSKPTEKDIWQKIGPWLAAAIIIGTGILIGFYLQTSLGNARYTPALIPSVSVAFTILLLIALGIVGMSDPDWRRVLVAVVGSLALAAVVTALFTYLAALAGAGTYIRWLYNTALLSVIRAGLQVFFCSMAAYALARLNFPLKNAIFGFILLSMTIPGAITLVPSYVLISKLGWINTWYSLVFPGLIVAGSIFILAQFFRAIPHALEEAAVIDGASYFQTYRDVIMPLARPALLTVLILQFQGMWNDYLGPLLYMQTNDMWVLNVALQVFQQQYAQDWNLVLVGAMVNAIPVLLLFALFSRYYIEGVSYAGVKG